MAKVKLDVKDVRTLLEAPDTCYHWPENWSAEALRAWLRIAGKVGADTEAIEHVEHEIEDQERMLAVLAERAETKARDLVGHPRYQIRRVDNGAVLVELTVPRGASFSWRFPFAHPPEGLLQWWANDGGEGEFVEKGDPFYARAPGGQLG